MGSGVRQLLKSAGHALLRRSGHFYAPWPDPNEAAIAIGVSAQNVTKPIPGIELDDRAMLALWDAMRPHVQQAPFVERQSSARRYWYANDYFGLPDGQIYYGMLARFRPRRIIEIGSGFSTALALDAVDQLGLKTEITLIEPEPARVRSLMRPADSSVVKLLECKAQDVAPACFSVLEEDDVLFIDSSHILKTGSDVNYELFHILPALRPGVLIHFHDINNNFEYPGRWVLDERRGWNEAYALRAFLMYNSAFKVIFFGSYLWARFDVAAGAASLWLRKIA